MPNWCEGNIRIRGSRGSIKAFLENEIAIVKREGLFKTKLMRAVVKEGQEYLEVSRGEEKEGDPEDYFYINGTRRNFIKAESIEVFVGDRERETVCIDGFRAAWGIDPSPYVEKARKYGVDIRIVGFERGMEFMAVVEIVNGELVKDVMTKFSDWDWECPMPNMGG